MKVFELGESDGARSLMVMLRDSAGADTSWKMWASGLGSSGLVEGME